MTIKQPTSAVHCRPILVLKSEQGFVGYKAGSAKLECNKATYETIHVERGDRGGVFFKG